MLFERVKSIIEKQLNLNDIEIKPETNLISGLGINSLDLVELVCAFEVEFDIVVPEKDIRRFTKVSDIIAYLEARQ
jgi:acyl carrier protein